MDLAVALTGTAVDEDAAAARSGAPISGNVLAHHGCERLLTLLTGLETMFPEKEELSAWTFIFKNTILNVPDMEETIMQRWHREMTVAADGSKREPSLYVKTRERDIEFLLASGVWVLDEIDVRSMYYDADVFPEDREAICQHLDKINACAEAMSAIPSDMMQSIVSCVSSIDPSTPMTAETTFAVMQKIIGCKPEDLADDTDAMERLVGWSQQLLDGFSSGGFQALQSLAGDAALLSGTGMPDMSALTALVQNELAGCGGDGGGGSGGIGGIGSGGISGGGDPMGAMAAMVSSMLFPQQ